jgi:DNA repair exonuclease SbcCD ATPase subunit
MNYQPAPEKSNTMTIVAVAAIVASIAANLFLLYQVNGLKDESAHAREVLQGEIDTLKENGTAMTASQRKHMDELRDDLDSRSKQLAAGVNQAKREAVSYADEKSKQLESEQQKTNAQIGQVSTAVSDVAKKADTITARVENVNNDVSGVKTDLTATKTSLDQTKSDLNTNIALLKKVQGDLGGTNSMVATNAHELDELKKLGQRNFVEFTLKKQKEMQKIGNISMKLDKADFKKNRFTLVVFADDKTWDKKDRNTNEPLQFYVAKSLYEVVVNSVSKDEKTITGYLSMPKYGENR